jgi:hypothetical protein
MGKMAIFPQIPQIPIMDNIHTSSIVTHPAWLTMPKVGWDTNMYMYLQNRDYRDLEEEQSKNSQQ